MSGVRITIGDNSSSFDLIDIYVDKPLALTDKLKYSGPIPKSVKIRALPVSALS